MHIRRLALAGILVACSMAAQVGPTMVAPVKADCDVMMVELDHIADARGTTFLGTVRYLSLQPAGDSYTFEVERTYAGSVPAQYTLRTGGCHGMSGFKVDRRYLVSTGDMFAPNAGNTIAWRIGRDERAALERLAAPPATYPRAARAVRTLDQAVALMAPGSTGVSPDEPPYGPIGMTYTAEALPPCASDVSACPVLVEVAGVTDTRWRWGAQVLPTDPPTFAQGLPPSLQPGRYLVSVMTWFDLSGTGPRLTGTSQSCWTQLDLTGTEMAMRIHVQVGRGECSVRALPATPP